MVLIKSMNYSGILKKLKISISLLVILMRCFFYTCLKPDITYLVHLEQIILIKFFLN